MGLTRQGMDFQHASYFNTFVLRGGGQAKVTSQVLTGLGFGLGFSLIFTPGDGTTSRQPRSLVRSLQGQGFDLGLGFNLVYTPGDGAITRQVRSIESVDLGHFRSGYLTW